MIGKVRSWKIKTHLVIGMNLHVWQAYILKQQWMS